MTHTWVELDLQTLAGNLQALRKVLGSRTEIIFVVKADAYSHGLAEVATCAWAEGVRWFAVAHLSEAVALRRILAGARILVVGALPPADACSAAALGAVPILASREHSERLAAHAAAGGCSLTCHAKIDTGMGRLGIPWESAAQILCGLAGRTGLNITGICTHFSCADDADPGRTRRQVERFRHVCDACEKEGLRFEFRHVSNSGGIVHGCDWSCDGVRPGILLYGYNACVPGGCEEDPESENGGAAVMNGTPLTRPFLSWKTRLVLVKRVPPGFAVSYGATYVTERETCIGTLDVGYSDGYSRAFSNKAQVLVRGRRCPVVGRVTMNLTMIDLGPESDAREGDVVTLLGQDGEEAIWADEIAQWSGTIPYEVLTNIRVPERRLVSR